MPGRRLDPTEGDQLRPGVHSLGDVFRFQPTVAEGDLTDVVSLAGQLTPGEVVRAVLPLSDHDVVAPGGRAELRSNQPAAQDTKGISAMSVPSAPISLATAERASFGWPLPAAVVDADSCPLIDELVVGVRESSAGEADRSSVQVHAVCSRWEKATSVTDVRDPRRWYRVGHDVNLPPE